MINQYSFVALNSVSLDGSICKRKMWDVFWNILFLQSGKTYFLSLF